MLGFLPSKQASSDDKLNAALEKFVLTAKILGLYKTPISSQLTLDTIRVLFNQDGITEKLAQAGKDFLTNKPDGVSKKEVRRTIPGFVTCCTKIELWLLGYDVPLDGKPTYKLPPADQYHTYAVEKYPVYHCPV